MSRNKITFLLVSFIDSIILILLDQISKFLAVKNLLGPGGDGNDRILIDGVFRLHYLENRGAAFSLLKDQKWFFIILTTVVCIGIVIFLFRIPATSKYLPLSACLVFLFSGAVGNLIDRVFNGYVIDFLYFELIDFPVFNVADIYVTCSVFVLFILILFKYKDNDFDFLKRKKANEE